MAACFKHAVEKGLSISIAPHLDDGLGLGGWRNGLVFDPLARYGSFSYAEFMLYPLADALNAAIGPNTKVSFALQGEMSATVFYYPKSYLTLIPYIKNRVLAGELFCFCFWSGAVAGRRSKKQSPPFEASDSERKSQLSFLSPPPSERASEEVKLPLPSKREA